MTTADPVKDRNVEVRRLATDEWRTFKSVRLRALRDAPAAFGSTAADAEQFTADDWQRRMALRAVFVGLAEGSVVGLACGIRGELEGEAELISMWVEPRWRGRGVADQLVHAVVAWATSHNFRRVRLWIASGNKQAERLYRRTGFTQTGEVQPMGKGSSMELSMILDLPAPGPVDLPAPGPDR